MPLRICQFPFSVPPRWKNIRAEQSRTGAFEANSSVRENRYADLHAFPIRRAAFRSVFKRPCLPLLYQSPIAEQARDLHRCAGEFGRSIFHTENEIRAARGRFFFSSFRAGEKKRRKKKTVSFCPLSVDARRCARSFHLVRAFFFFYFINGPPAGNGPRRNKAGRFLTI